MADAIMYRYLRLKEFWIHTHDIHTYTYNKIEENNSAFDVHRKDSNHHLVFACSNNFII